MHRSIAIALAASFSAGSVFAAEDALKELNAARAARGLPAYIFDAGLTAAAKGCADHRASYLIAGHSSNDFGFLPSGVSAGAAGCAAWTPDWGWGSCCSYENWQYAGAAVAYGRDGRRYMQLYVNNGPSAYAEPVATPAPAATVATPAKTAETVSTPAKAAATVATPAKVAATVATPAASAPAASTPAPAATTVATPAPAAPAAATPAKAVTAAPAATVAAAPAETVPASYYAPSQPTVQTSQPSYQPSGRKRGGRRWR
ncbi:MAG TPA: hypothetical protein VNC50_09310 [Planctomycetia bacterium]|nr:hypothetical protein [Planctomycetia bacterium]